MKPSTAPLSQLRRAFARYDTRRNTPSGGGSRLRANPVHGCDSGNWAQTGTRWPGTRAVVHEQLSWFIRVRRSAIRVPVRCVAGSAAYCLNKSRALTDARVRERFQRGWRGRRGGEGCGAARDAAHGAARRCVSRRMCPHRLILLTTCLGVIVLVVTILGGSGVKRHRARRAAGVTAVRRSRCETLRSARGVGPLLGRPASRLSDNEFFAIRRAYRR